MTIYQTLLFVCEICGMEISETKEVNLYSEDSIFSEGWDYTSDYDKLACPECLKKNEINITKDTE